MGRRPRIHVYGAVYHVMTRGNGGEEIISPEADWNDLIAALNGIKTTAPFDLYAYCLMPNHFHLLLRVQATPISRLMQRLLTVWAKRFNVTNGRRGHVFQGRFKSISCNSNAHFLWLIRYIHLNPVRAQLVASPKEWQWSSHNEYLGLAQIRLSDCDWPLSLFGKERSVALSSYNGFILQGLEEQDKPPDFTDSRLTQEDKKPLKEEPHQKPGLTDMARQVASETGISDSLLLQPCRIREVCAARRILVERALKSGYRIAELATGMGLSSAAVSKMISAISCIS